VNHISARATRVLNLLRKNMYSCFADAKALAYTSLVLSHPEFASAAWDHSWSQSEDHTWRNQFYRTVIVKAL
jgi:hypothetical protein